jgi:N-acetylglucosamine kinase-like BadF-type ATPase
MDCILAIDCGATKSEAAILPVDYINKFNKSSYHTFNFPSINYNLLGLNQSAERICKIAYYFKNKSKIIKLIAAGISGARFKKDRNKLEKEIKKRTNIKNVYIYTDTEIAFESEFEKNDKNCGILIAGTGSILFYKNEKGNINRIGGWGRIIGDEGSGYWIAKEALILASKHYDNITNYNNLIEILEKKFSITKHNIIEKIYTNGFEIQRITKYIFELAENGDRISKQLIKFAASKLAENFKPLKNKKYIISLTGSLFTQSNLLANELFKISKKEFPYITLTISKNKPILGAIKKAIDIFQC